MEQRKTLGIETLTALAYAIAGSANVVGSVMADKKVDYKDLSQAPAALSNLKAYTDVDFNQVLPELNDLTGEESDELSKTFEKAFNIKDKSKEETIEQGFKVLLQGYEAIKIMIQIGEKIADGFSGEKDQVANTDIQPAQGSPVV